MPKGIDGVTLTDFQETSGKAETIICITTSLKKDTPWDDLHEECGVFGMYDFDGGDVASTIYYGLFALQHRGQESHGIAVSETDGP